jgi:hypothetical protein
MQVWCQAAVASILFIYQQLKVFSETPEIPAFVSSSDDHPEFGISA